MQAKYVRTRARIRSALTVLALALLGTLIWLLPRLEAARLKTYYVTLVQDAQVVTIGSFQGMEKIPAKTVTRRDRPEFFSSLQEAMRRGAAKTSNGDGPTPDIRWQVTVTGKNGRRTEVLIVEGYLSSRSEPKSEDLHFYPRLAEGKEGIADKVTELMGAPQPSR